MKNDRAIAQTIFRRILSLTETGLLSAGEWACRGLSGYDATFVALAEETDGRWLTADRAAARIAGPKRALHLKAWVNG